MNNPIRLMATAMIADNSFTRISPRQLQHYLLRTTYKPQTWLTFAGTTNILESRDNVQTVNHLEHTPTPLSAIRLHPLYRQPEQRRLFALQPEHRCSALAITTSPRNTALSDSCWRPSSVST